MNEFPADLMKGKKGIVTGIANNMSIAWHIAQALYHTGAELILTYPSIAIKNRILDISEEIEVNSIEPLDVLDENSIDNLFSNLEKKFEKLDFIVHSIAFSDKEELRGRFIDTSLKNFLTTMQISCFSLNSLAKRAEKLMQKGSSLKSQNAGGSILTLSYYGSDKVFPGYNVMGVAKAALESSVKYLAYDMGTYNIRVNAISAGPIQTLASRGISNFNDMLKIHSSSAPLRRKISGQDVAKSALYLLSDLSPSVTGEIHYVDGGYNIMGINA